MKKIISFLIAVMLVIPGLGFAERTPKKVADITVILKDIPESAIAHSDFNCFVHSKVKTKPLKAKGIHWISNADKKIFKLEIPSESFPVTAVTCRLSAVGGKSHLCEGNVESSNKVTCKFNK